jgi:anti-sigma factor RsiW
MKHPDIIERLSALLDGELDAESAQDVENHLAACAECRDAAEDLNRILTAAREMPPAPPRQDLWPAIAARLDHPAEATVELGSSDASWWRRRLVLSWPQALGAAAAVAAVTVATAFWVTRGPETSGTTQAHLAAQTESLAASSDAAYGALADEVQVLHERLDAESGRLDPETVRVLTKNLRLIDDAIAQSRAALASDPASADETGRFVASLSGKLELLRQATDVALAQANGG